MIGQVQDYMYEFTVKESHLDTFGHVNNATYLQIFEEARWELITLRGYGFNEVHSLKQGPVILEINLKFAKELRLREKISIQFELLEYQNKIGRFKQTMVRKDGSVAAEMIMIFGLFDLNQRKLIEPTEAWKKAVGLS